VSTPSQTTYGLLGMLAVRSYTGYELTQQVRRSLRFIWSSSEAHLYREQKRLVELGWATVELEPAGQRSRKRYTITPEGRYALSQWLSTEPEEPHFQIEGIMRTFFGTHGTTENIVNAMQSTTQSTHAMLDEMLGFVDEYLEEGGPLTMLEEGFVDEFHGRPMFPERLHVVSLAIDLVTRLLETMEEFFGTATAEVARWPSPSEPSLTAATRARLEAIRARSSGEDAARPPESAATRQQS
jgi:PadR family transcriptional regulator AphA